ncbi:hypothetical protein J7400_18965 [Shimia sp. R9_2]|uniref:hypothetical protein n=1 Tax=Shimia sp. R9_2 TaxID=2821112 RepID=UPI001ADBCA42|nr:hypothetical protein [Shimia sp. R9_2]MBO9398759.1 hypothetical protein [Shimia sp. R9_2]
MSDNVYRLPGAEELQKELQVLRGGGDGPYDGGMEARVEKLEASVERISDRLTSIEVSLARIDAKLDSKIDYKWLAVYVFGIIAVVLRSEIASLFSSGTP